ncbi:MAG: relaxase/mobilization nuclease domain-containing protein [Hyphomonadaceae bacterium]|nr:relaxase/mobilization nuclease domain-containing protein [Hyphomonadaceae bacterium]
MIIKGKSRGGPKQLETHLQRVDTNERVEVLEKPATAATIGDAFGEWQTIAEGTRGRYGLYHANIDPDASYSMTAAQWTRAVDLLERELGLDGQPRVVVLHEKNDRQHIHVVWQRTDIDTMTLLSDSNNYDAHKRVARALEKEFGHEAVVTKPAEERAPISHAEWQQAERSGHDPRAFKDQVTALFHASENGAALQKTLDDHGLIVAQGDRRDFVIVDQAGEVYSLARQIKGMTAKDLRGFMADVDADALPTVAEAKALQELRPALEPKPLSEAPTATPPAEDGKSGAKLDEALRAWHAEDMQRLADFHAAERDRIGAMLDQEIAAKVAQSDATRTAALERYDEQAERKGFARVVDAVIGFVSPAWASRRQAERDEARNTVVKALDREHAEEAARLEAGKKVELDDLAERQAQQARDRELVFGEDLARRTRDYEEAQRFAAQLAEQQRQREQAAHEQQTQTAGPEPPTSAR